MQLLECLKTPSSLHYHVSALADFFIKEVVARIVACPLGDCVGQVFCLFAIALLSHLSVDDLHLLFTSFNKLFLVHVGKDPLSTLRLQHHLLRLLFQLCDFGVDLCCSVRHLRW